MGPELIFVFISSQWQHGPTPAALLPFPALSQLHPLLAWAGHQHLILQPQRRQDSYGQTPCGTAQLVGI